MGAPGDVDVTCVSMPNSSCEQFILSFLRICVGEEGNGTW